MNFDPAFRAEKLNEKDVYALLELYRSNPQFLDLSKSVCSLKSIEADMLRTPSGVVLDQKFYLGIYENNKLIAVCDLILDYPNNMEAWIGLFMVEGKEQNNGKGTVILQSIENMLASAGISHVELGVIDKNNQGLSFWKKNGYSQKSKNQDVLVLEKELPVKEEIYEPEWEDTPSQWTF